jgi:cytoskeleton protein RodZ
VFEIGSSLREARMRQGLDLADAEAATKIRLRHLAALEDERFDLLPAQAYVKGFLRTYADYLGLEGQMYVDEFTSRFGRGEDDLPTEVSARRPRPKPARQVETAVILVALAGIAAVTGLVVAAWTWGGSPPPREPNLAAPPAATAPAAGNAAGAPQWIRLEISAPRGQSALVVRRGSRTGRLLFEGTLERGRTMSFVGPRVWVSAGAPQNLELQLNRRPVRVPPSNERPARILAGPRGVRTVPAG